MLKKLQGVHSNVARHGIAWKFGALSVLFAVVGGSSMPAILIAVRKTGSVTGVNLITNPSFESWSGGVPTVWTNYGTPGYTQVTTSHAGSYAASIASTSSSYGTAGTIYQQKLMTAGQIMTASCWLKSSSAISITSQLKEYTSAWGTPSGSPSVATNTLKLGDNAWHQLTTSYTVLSTGDMLNMSYFATSVKSTSGSYIIDDCSLTAADPQTSDTTPPSAPSSLTAAVTSPTASSLTWTAATDNVGVTGYTVQRDGVTVGTTSSLSYSDAGLMSGTTYAYSVTASDAAGNIGPAATAQVVTPVPTPPAAPSGLTLTGSTATTASLSWTPSAAGTYSVGNYTVWRDGTVVATTPGTSFNDSGLTPGANYVYTVSAADTSGNSGPASDSLTVTTATATPPSAPAGLIATATSSSQVNLTWQSGVAGTYPVASYTVSRDGAVLATTSNPTYTDNGLSAGTNYSYTVTAVDTSGVSGPASVPVSATTQSASVTTSNTLTPTIDTQLNAASPSTAYGSTATLYSSLGSYASLFRFDATAAMNGQTVTSVTFNPFINQVASTSDKLNVYAVDANWSASSTWNSASAERAQCSGTPLATQTIPAGATRVSISLPVSAVNASGAVNLCTTTTSSTGQIRINSMEGSLLPRLQIATSGTTAAPKISYTDDTATTVMKLSDTSITDGSSWAVSKLNNGVRWINQDRTHQSPQAYAIGPTGQTVATVTMTGNGMTNIDPEDAAAVTLNGTPYVYIYDGGGNLDVRSAIYVHRFIEPSLNTAVTGQAVSAAADTWSFTYPAGDLNASRTAGPDSEAIMVNPATGQMFFIVKSTLGLSSGTLRGIYAAPMEASSTPGNYQLTKVGTTTQTISSATWSADGTEFALRTGANAYVYKVQNGDVAAALATTPLNLTTPSMQQSEGISFSADGQALELSTEYHSTTGNAPIVRQPLPATYYVAPISYGTDQASKVK